MSDVLGVLQETFGYSEFREGQREVVEALLRGHSALAVFPTGGGKSICYQLPALMLDGVTVVVSPLIALMKDQIDYLRGRGVAADRLDSTLNAQEAAVIMDSLRANTVKLLYVAPERFNNERFMSVLKHCHVSLLAVDEAHCISAWGHNFRPDYLKLATAAREIGAERVLALTATATPKVVNDISAAFGIDNENAIVTGFYRPNLTMLTTPVTSDTRDALLISRLKERAPGSGIVYVTLQKTAERVAEMLQQAGIKAKAYHAGMDSELRAAVQDWWAESNDGIVVATIAFGMGIDKANVRYVYHYNLPKGLESYSQEIGRAGRDGAPSVVELFVCADDVATLENFVYGDTPTEAALRGLVDTVIDGANENGELSLSLYDLSSTLDLRPLVLRTAITYLELGGVIREGTPVYTGYDIKPLRPIEEIVAEFPGKAGEFVSCVFGQAKKRRLWYSLTPVDVATKLGCERRRVERCLEVMQERRLVELKPGDLRHRYTRLRAQEDDVALTADLMSRFQQREHQEIVRIDHVLKLAVLGKCQVNALVGYFGQKRAEPCGHCTFCVTGEAQQLAPARELPPIYTVVAADYLAELQSAQPNALGEARQAARFLCGLSSPATIRARLLRHPLFGALDDRRFADVLAWVESAR